MQQIQSVCAKQPKPQPINLYCLCWDCKLIVKWLNLCLCLQKRKLGVSFTITPQYVMQYTCHAFFFLVLQIFWKMWFNMLMWMIICAPVYFTFIQQNSVGHLWQVPVATPASVSIFVPNHKWLELNEWDLEKNDQIYIEFTNCEQKWMKIWAHPAKRWLSLFHGAVSVRLSILRMNCCSWSHFSETWLMTNILNITIQFSYKLL